MKMKILSQKLKAVFTVFWTFFKIGAMTFGGGYAMIAILEREIVEKKGWLKCEDFLDMVAISESTPGPIAINMATYLGYRKSGVIGSVAATLGVVLPSFTIIYIISLVFDFFISIKLIAAAFKGIQICVVYLILSAGIKLTKKLKKTPFTIFTVLCVSAFMTVFSLFAVNFSSIFYILIFGFISLTVYSVHNRGGAK